jgi:hypothetical protein
MRVMRVRFSFSGLYDAIFSLRSYGCQCNSSPSYDLHGGFHINYHCHELELVSGHRLIIRRKMYRCFFTIFGFVFPDYEGRIIPRLKEK